jgi:hypothetical protein
VVFGDLYTSHGIGPLIADNVRIRRYPNGGEAFRRNLRPAAKPDGQQDERVPLRENFIHRILRYACNAAADSKSFPKAFA